jgi:uncharacterized protein YuzE
MRLVVDEEADALPLHLVDMPVAESNEIAPGVIVDDDESNQVVGIEVLCLSTRRPPVNPMDVQFQVSSKTSAPTEQ